MPGFLVVPSRIFQSVVKGTPEASASAASCGVLSRSSSPRSSVVAGMVDLMSGSISHSEWQFNRSRYKHGAIVRSVKKDLKKILWGNVQSLMKQRWGEENLNRLAREAGFGPATASRIKEQKTDIGLDTLDKLARLFGLEPGELLADGAKARPQYSPYATEVAQWFDAMQDPAKQERAHSIIYSMCVADRWPALGLTQPAPEPTGAPRKTVRS